MKILRSWVLANRLKVFHDSLDKFFTRTNLRGTPKAGPAQPAAVNNGLGNKFAAGPTDLTFRSTAPAAPATSAAAGPAKPQRRNGRTAGSHPNAVTSETSIPFSGQDALAASSSVETAPTSNKQLHVTDGGWYEIEDILKHMEVKGVLHLGSVVYARQVGAHSLTLGHGGRLVCLDRRRVETTVCAGIAHPTGRTQLCTDHHSVVVVVTAGRKPRVVHESILCDPIQSNPSTDRPNPL